ncbi:unnamed protein product [Owenia fusiformis]|uniref:Uncharacterized protein n=1 Tax=Owenia fusiformis TaxID=6347 RepID=A0A8J1XVR0_OWEFU|nr:unnamed protein product [Owenia fusiformis]
MAFEGTCEALTGRQKGLTDFGENIQKSLIATLGAFYIGYSSGTVLQVRLGKRIPTRAQNAMVIPTVMGVSLAYSVHQFMKKKYGETWATQTIPLANRDEKSFLF